jgi:hypothetical protein
MQKHLGSHAAYHFKRAPQEGMIHVLNEGSYVMGEYSERTGRLKWVRVVLAAQREKIENWLNEHYPAQSAAAAARR